MQLLLTSAAPSNIGQGGDTIVQTRFCVSPCAWVKLFFSVSRIVRVIFALGPCSLRHTTPFARVILEYGPHALLQTAPPPAPPMLVVFCFLVRQMLLFAPFIFCAAKCVFAVCGCALLPRRPSEPPLVHLGTRGKLHGAHRNGKTHPLPAQNNMEQLCSCFKRRARHSRWVAAVCGAHRTPSKKTGAHP